MVLRRSWRPIAVGLAALVLIALWVASRSVCLTAWVRHGVALEQCPDGAVRLTYALSAESLRRGGTGEVSLEGTAHYVTDEGHRASEPFDGFSAALELVDAEGKRTPLPLAEDAAWRRERRSQRATVAVPQLPDGEYSLVAKVGARAGDQEVSAPAAFFAPARVQVLTDRPLYEPGHTIQFRAVVLRAQDLMPLEGRPGRWTVIDAEGQQVLEERSETGPWGVISGSFPLDRGAPTGTWRIVFGTHLASGEATVRVEPFTVPRFSVEAQPLQPAYGMGERPVVKGTVRYASGAPVAKATVELDWTLSGPWPAPRAWAEGALPRTAIAAADGSFTLQLPEVPFDLRGRNVLLGRIAAVDPAGDRVSSQVSLLLAQDRIQADAVTELGDGLVEGYNNRLFIRAASAAGAPLAGAELTVKRAWDPRDPGITAVADEDGVASLQLDPGAAVNVLIPAMPYRPAPPEPSVTLDGLEELIGGDEVSLADQVSLEQALSGFERCALFTLEDAEARVAIRVAASGAVTQVASDDSRLGRCLVEVARARRFSPGADRLLAASLTVAPADAPWIEPEVTGVPEVPSEVGATLADALLSARSCLPRDAASGTLSRAVEWRTRKGSSEVSFSFVSASAGRTPEAIRRCVESKVPSRTLATRPFTRDAMGVAQLILNEAEGEGEEARPQATTFLGYEFVVTARAHGRELGSTRLQLRPGSVPPLRLRPSKVVTAPGEVLELDVLRGPTFAAELPEEAHVTLGATVKPLKVDREAKKVRYEVPSDARGWLEFELSGARARVFVQTASDLVLSLGADRDAYAPGAMAVLDVQTRRGGQPVAAAVGLFGVDETLGQLAPLPGADTFSAVQPQVAMTAPAFGVLDAQALVQGRIRGANAAMATVLRVAALPAWAQADLPVHAVARTSVDDNGELTEAFYNVLSELHVQARRWEAEAPKEAMASPQTIASLWASSVEAVAARGEKTTDAFGRRLRLSQLPPDLLALTDPRAVVIAGTRLPEDVENWGKWVAEEAP